MEAYKDKYEVPNKLRHGQNINTKTKILGATRLNDVKKEHLHSQYLHNILLKYLNSIIGLQKRIQFILNQLKYSRNNKWCDVFKLSKVNLLLQQLQEVLQRYTYKEYSEEYNRMQNIRYSEYKRYVCELQVIA